MKQVLVYPRIGIPRVCDVPDPTAHPGQVVIDTCASLISPGTERASMELHRASLIMKARRRPDLVRQVIAKVRTEGLAATVRKVRSRLAQPFAPGYSCAGYVIERGSGIEGIAVGDRVAAAGFGYAAHAERVAVPRNLTAKIPDEVTFSQAAFGTLGAIALHGVRVTGPAIGETVAVVGLGILGQLAAQILTAAGVRVIAVEPDSFRQDLARQSGISCVCAPGDPAKHAVLEHTHGRGADAIIITAAAHAGELVNEAAELARDRGVVTIVGDVPLHLSRRLFYEKELELRLSRSYGPGRYDRQYEEQGEDYPYAYVRWTEQRNLEAFLDLLAHKKVKVDHLITDTFPIDRAAEAYHLLKGADAGRHLAVLFEYPVQHRPATPVVIAIRREKAGKADGVLGVGFIGFGQFAAGVMLPAFRSIDRVHLTGVATTRSATAHAAATSGGFRFATTDWNQIIDDPDTDIVIIATTHDLHAELAVNALAKGKAVFLEKPMALNPEGLADVVRAVREHGPRLQVGFNRRFSPALMQIKEVLIGRSGPLSIDYRICAGLAPSIKKHWVVDPDVGGGRLRGEVCHFIDAVLFLTDAYPQSIHARSLSAGEHDDALALTLQLSDGSVAHIRYLTQPGPQTPKEKIDIVGRGITANVDDFRQYGWTASTGRMHRHGAQDKGHTAQFKVFVHSLRNKGLAAGDFIGAVYATQTTFAAEQSLRRGEPIPVRMDF